MGELDSDRRVDDLGAGRIAKLGRQQHQQGPEPLAARAEQVSRHHLRAGVSELGSPRQFGLNFVEQRAVSRVEFGGQGRFERRQRCPRVCHSTNLARRAVQTGDATRKISETDLLPTIFAKLPCEIYLRRPVKDGLREVLVGAFISGNYARKFRENVFEIPGICRLK